MPKVNEIPSCPRVPAVRGSNRVVREYKISLATPLFGGGVEAGTPDESMPIRGTAIRGQLQFWWRAARGANFVTYEKLFVRHGEIWGTTEIASPIEIEVLNVAPRSARPCARYNWNQKARGGRGRWQPTWEMPFQKSSLPYALFPFQGKAPASPQGVSVDNPAKFIETISFTLRLRYPEAIQKDVEAAIWAWVNFGGLGARTRRGCGALFCKELAPNDINDIQRWFEAGSISNSNVVRDWPTMPSCVLVGNRPEAVLDAWNRVVGLLQTFRQGVGVARNSRKQGKRPGRSRYPEPETIRRVTGQHSHKHSRIEQIPDDAFPRADFGLPIVFHFQGGGGEPPDTVLYPSEAENGKDYERMASPLILKPLLLANQKAVPLVLKLIAPPPSAVNLRWWNERSKQNESVKLRRTTAIRHPRLATYPSSPLASSPSGSATEAFLLYVLQDTNGFHEVTR